MKLYRLENGFLLNLEHIVRTMTVRYDDITTRFAAELVNNTRLYLTDREHADIWERFGLVGPTELR